MQRFRRAHYTLASASSRPGETGVDESGCCLRKPDIGEKVWARFNVPTKQTLWYYRSLADIFCERLSNQLSNELREIVEVLKAEVGKARRRVT
jgi:hypothetical protein